MSLKSTIDTNMNKLKHTGCHGIPEIINNNKKIKSILKLWTEPTSKTDALIPNKVSKYSVLPMAGVTKKAEKKSGMRF